MRGESRDLFEKKYSKLEEKVVKYCSQVALDNEFHDIIHNIKDIFEIIFAQRWNEIGL